MREVDEPEFGPKDTVWIQLKKTLEYKVISINVVLTTIKRDIGEMKRAEDLAKVVNAVKFVQGCEKALA